MSVCQLIYLVCDTVLDDGSDCLGSTESAPSLAEARYCAATNGWTTVEGLDYCATHSGGGA